MWCRAKCPPVSAWSRTWKRLLSYALFLLCFSVPLVLIFFLLFRLTWIKVQFQYQMFTNHASALSVSEWWPLLQSVLVSSIISLANAIFFAIVGCLTQLECHDTWSAYRSVPRHMLCL